MLRASATFSRPTYRGHRVRRGAAAVEFACVCVLFFTLILTLFELSRGLMVDYYLANAARQACREGMIPSRTTSDITQAAQDALANCRITGATISVLVNGSPVEASSAQSGDRITVKITIPVSAITIVPLTRYLSGNLSGQYTLRRE